MTLEEAKEYIQMNKSVLQQRLQSANEDLDTDRVQDYNLALGRLFEAFDMATEALTKVERYEKAFGNAICELSEYMENPKLRKANGWSDRFKDGIECAYHRVIINMNTVEDENDDDDETEEEEDE